MARPKTNPGRNRDGAVGPREGELLRAVRLYGDEQYEPLGRLVTWLCGIWCCEFDRVGPWRCETGSGQRDRVAQGREQHLERLWIEVARVGRASQKVLERVSVQCVPLA